MQSLDAIIQVLDFLPLQKTIVCSIKPEIFEISWGKCYLQNDDDSRSTKINRCKSALREISGYLRAGWILKSNVEFWRITPGAHWEAPGARAFAIDAMALNFGFVPRNFCCSVKLTWKSKRWAIEINTAEPNNDLELFNLFFTRCNCTLNFKV